MIRAENGHFRPCSESFSALFATRAENGPFSALVRTIFGPVRNQGRKWAIFGPDHVDFHALGHSVQNWIRLENALLGPMLLNSAAVGDAHVADGLGHVIDDVGNVVGLRASSTWLGQNSETIQLTFCTRKYTTKCTQRYIN